MRRRVGLQRLILVPCILVATAAVRVSSARCRSSATLQVGAPGDVAILDRAEDPVSFVDTRGNKRDGKLQLKPVQTVIDGVPFGRPYQSPFSVR